MEWIQLQVHSPAAKNLALGLVRGTPLRNAVEVLGAKLERVSEAVASALARLGG
jgi:hypothetical protein